MRFEGTKASIGKGGRGWEKRKVPRSAKSGSEKKNKLGVKESHRYGGGKMKAAQTREMFKTRP